MKFLTESILGTLKSIRTYPIYTLSGTNLVKDLARLLNSRIGSILNFHTVNFGDGCWRRFMLVTILRC